jgi:hypothetical protein
VDEKQDIILEFTGIDTADLDGFSDELAQAGVDVLPLEERDPGLLISFLIGVTTSFSPNLAKLIAERFKSKGKEAVSVTITRKGGHKLAISSDQELAVRPLTEMIEDFLQK